MKPIEYIDAPLARSLLPERAVSSHKGDFGRLLVITGSDKYRGAAHLSLEAALRGGAGYVTFIGTEVIAEELRMKFPEAIYKTVPPTSELSEGDISAVSQLSMSSGAVLVGCGSTVSRGLYSLLTRLLLTEGGALILDADAINAIAEHGAEGRALLKKSASTGYPHASPP